jgi:hypothetical protein
VGISVVTRASAVENQDVRQLNHNDHGKAAENMLRVSGRTYCAFSVNK